MAWNRRTLLATGIGSVGSLLLGAEAHARRSSPEPGLVSGSGAHDNRVALVIATQRYQYHDQIETAYNDAKAMGRALTEQGGFSLVGDKVHVDRRQAELRNLVTAFLEAAEHADLAVIYLAGYCERRPSDQQLFYLAMSARGDRATALHNEALGLHDAVLLPAADVLARNPRLRLVTMVDNYVAPTLVGHYDRAPENPTRLDLPPRTLLSVSSKPHMGATATMVQRSGHGHYANGALTHLFRPRVTVQTAFSRLQSEVARTSNHTQQAFFVSSLGASEPLLTETAEDAMDIDALLDVQTVRVDPDDRMVVGCVAGIDDSHGFSCRMDERPKELYLSPFRLMATEVSQGLWDRVASSTAGLPTSRRRVPKNLQDPDLPMMAITWYEAARFCNAATALVNERGADLIPAYRFRRSSSGREVEVTFNPDATGWHLPTEDAWEVAARLSNAGPRTPFAGDMHGASELCLAANVLDDSLSSLASCQDRHSSVAPVHQLRQGAFYSLTGNAWEWCWDRYTADRSGAGELVARGGSARVVRGGAWDFDLSDARTARRFSQQPTTPGHLVGMRMARGLQRVG